jgi:hypothetical protein
VRSLNAERWTEIDRVTSAHVDERTSRPADDAATVFWSINRLLLPAKGNRLGRVRPAELERQRYKRADDYTAEIRGRITSAPPGSLREQR